MFPVEPQIFLGQQSTGFNSDSPHTAYFKYNNHIHWASTPSSFLYENVAIGDAVQLVNANGIDVFAYAAPNINPVVAAINPHSLVISVTAREAATNATLILPSGRTIEYVSIARLSNTVLRLPQMGMLRPNVLSTLLEKEYHGTFSPATVVRIIPFSFNTYRPIRLVTNSIRTNPSLNSHYHIRLRSSQNLYQPELNTALTTVQTLEFNSNQPLIVPGDSLNLELVSSTNIQEIRWSLLLYQLV